MKTIRCIDCGKVLEGIPNVVAYEAWDRWEYDDKGSRYFIGFVCNQCHFNAIKREEWITG